MSRADEDETARQLHTSIHGAGNVAGESVTGVRHKAGYGAASRSALRRGAK
jgi:hypothetical protein